MQEDNDAAVGAPADQVLVEPSAADSAIEARLKRIMRASGWYDSLGVEVREGIAFLDGATSSDRRRSWAGDLARQTQGVVAVINRIEVRPEISWDFTPAWNEARHLLLNIQQSLPLVLLSIIVLIAAWQAARLAAWLARWAFAARISSPLMLMVTARAFAVPVFILGVYFVLQISGLTRLALTVLGGTGLAGIVLGFAFRDIAENFLASLLLSIRNPFRAGDFIRLGEHEGTVKNLNTRTTVLVTIDGDHVQIPNATVFKSVITNFSTNPSRRESFLVGIGYDDSTSAAQTIIEAVLDAHPAVLEDPAPFVVVDELAASTVNLRVYFWFDRTNYSPIKLTSALMRQTKRALMDGGISLPDEAREVIFPQGVPVLQQGGQEADRPVLSAPATGLPDEADVTPAEGGLQREDIESLREAGASPGPDEKENLLRGDPADKAGRGRV